MACLQPVQASDLINLDLIPQDLKIPSVTNDKPEPGKRVRQSYKEYYETEIHHVLYLPNDWKEGKKYPVIMEYAGNKANTSLGTVEGCSLGYGISEGTGVIWVCLPFVDIKNKKNATNWWGDVETTVNYCKKTVNHICTNYGGDPTKIVLAGFSRGSIACNYIGLHDDEIASLWCGFICHSHYDGVRNWQYPRSDRISALKRLKRLGNRPQFISHENSVEQTRTYVLNASPKGNFNFLSLPFKNHTDTWVLKNIPERTILRNWFHSIIKSDK